MSPGQYSVHLKLCDPAITLEDRPEYSIRLANNDIWDSTFGYNDLDHHVNITSSGNTCSTGNEFASVNKWKGPDNAIWNASNTYWSQGRIPTECDEVYVQDGKTVIIPSG